MASQVQPAQAPADISADSYLELPPPEETLSAAASVPWVAIALAVHAILVVIAWFILPAAPTAPAFTQIMAAREQIADPPIPEAQPERQTEWFDDKQVETEPVEDKHPVTENDDTVEDPTDSPKQSLAMNPNEDPSQTESPHPNKRNPSSAVGLGGPPGGGGGPGGEGGYFRRRPRIGDGGPKQVDPRIPAALEWLRDHQNREGYWSATTFSADSTRAGAQRTFNAEFSNIGVEGGDAGWEATCDVGLTGLALLAFTGAGYDHKTGEFRSTVRNALIYLRKVQDNDGCFGAKEDDHFVYNHAICTMAIAELYGLSGEPLIKPIGDRAVDFMLKAQNPGLGWRYGVKPGMNDSSVTGWMVLTLHTCQLAGLSFDDSKCYTDAADWFETVTIDVNGYPKCGYDKPGSDCARLRSAQGAFDPNPSMDAIYVMSMLFMGQRKLEDREVRSMAAVCLEKDFLPRWEQNKIDYYYWYYASLALYQMGGKMWDRWEQAMVGTLLDHQRGFSELDRKKNLTTGEALDEHGSWDPVDAWGEAGGRVYSTAINCLTLSTYYRHLRLEEKK